MHTSHFNPVLLFATPETIAYQAPLSMGFSRHEYWSGLPCLPPGDLPNPGFKAMSLMSLALAGGFFTTRATWEAHPPQSCFTRRFFPLLGLRSIPLRLAPRRLTYGRHGYHVIQKHLTSHQTKQKKITFCS